MRLLPIAIFCLLASTVPAQDRHGTYKVSKDEAVPWTINQHHTLIWSGQPYLPIGIRTESAADIDAAAKAGIQDVIVSLPVNGMGWDDSFRKLEANAQRYLIEFDSLAAGAQGIAVEPQGFRVVGIMDDRDVDVTIPGATSALAVVVTRRDGIVQSSSRVKLKDGHFHLAVKAMAGMEQILLIYPSMTSPTLPDFWEDFDSQRDELLLSLTKHSPGKGLRGLVDPMGKIISLQNQEAKFIPSSPFFKMELRAFLEEKYKTVPTLVKSWNISASDITEWDQAVRLVPLWAGSRGIPKLWDTKSDQLYTVDSKKSTVWADFDTVIATAMAKRFSRLCEAIHKVCDVPVLQDWAGWATPYENNDISLDGLGMKAHGENALALAESGGRAASSLLRWKSSGWLLATDLQVSPTAEGLPAMIEDLTSLGARGLFFRLPATSFPALAPLAKTGTDVSEAQWSPSAIFYPESAGNPAATIRLPGGKWWLPSPAAGNRIELGAGFYAYRYSDGSNAFFALWTTGGAGRVKLRMADAKTVTFATTDGSDPKPKLYKFGVEVNVSDLPLIIQGTSEIPVPEPTLNDLLAGFSALAKSAETRMKDITEETYLFGDAATGVERNPGGSYSQMRNQYNRVAMKLAPWVWIEAENCKNHNFSDVAAVPGCSGGNVLSLKTQLGAPAGGFVADYTAPVRTDDDVQVWVAARIPRNLRHSVQMNIGGQILTIEEEGISQYGTDFAWYKLGTTHLKGSSQAFQLQVVGTDNADLSIDAIVFYPGEFKPSGVAYPSVLRQ